MSDGIEMLSAGATALGAFVALFSAWDARRSANKQIRETERQQEETRRQAKVAVEQLVSSHGLVIRQWSDDVIETIGRSITLCHCHENNLSNLEFVRERSQVVQRLSALLDKGRLLFPNEDHDQYGTHKPKAFRGIRQAVLDDVADTHDATEGMKFEDPEFHLRDLIEARRQFVSEIQECIDPRSQQKRLRELVGESLYAKTSEPNGMLEMV
jgi:hypothetical protein